MSTKTMIGFHGAFGTWLGLAALGLSTLAPDASVAVADPARVLGPQSCAECHEAEFAVWSETGHQVSSTDLTRDPRAREIAAALGIRRIKSDDRCTSCHYTMQAEEGRDAKAVAGVSCESCHGGAADWVDLHQDFGATGATSATESPEHRAERLEQCSTAGMRHPDQVVEVAGTCYACHVIADRELIAAGHPTGEGFELLRWSQGEIRHNFVRGAGENAEASTERKRLLLVMGPLLELEYSLRGMSLDEGEGEPDTALTQRAQAVLETLELIAALAPEPRLTALVARAREVTAGPSAADVAELSDAVRSAAAELESSHGIEGRAELDVLIPTPESYRGRAAR